MAIVALLHSGILTVRYFPLSMIDNIGYTLKGLGKITTLASCSISYWHEPKNFKGKNNASNGLCAFPFQSLKQ